MSDLEIAVVCLWVFSLGSVWALVKRVEKLEETNRKYRLSLDETDE